VKCGKTYRNKPAKILEIKINNLPTAFKIAMQLDTFSSPLIG
jgi:hypothetical protein